MSAREREREGDREKQRGREGERERGREELEGTGGGRRVDMAATTMAPTMAAAEGNELVRKSSKRNVDGVLREGSNLSDAAGEGTTGLTNYVGDANLDWEAPANAEEIAPKTRTLSFRKVLRTSSFRKKEKEQVGFVSLLRDSTVHGLLHLPPVSLCDHVTQSLSRFPACR